MDLLNDWRAWGKLFPLITEYNSFKQCGLKQVQAISVDGYIQKYVSAEVWYFWQQMSPEERAVLRNLGIARS